MGTPGVSLFLKQAHFGRVKGRYWTCHGPTIKAPFESSTFINLKQSIDLKAESSKLPERIIKTASLEFGTLQCNLHEAFYCERWPAHLPPVTPCPYSEQLLSPGFHAFALTKGGGDRGVSVGSRLPPSLGLSAGESAQIPGQKNNSVDGVPQPAVAAPRATAAIRGSGVFCGLAAPARGARVSSKLRRGNFKPPFGTHPPTPYPPPPNTLLP